MILENLTKKLSYKMAFEDFIYMLIFCALSTNNLKNCFIV